MRKSLSQTLFCGSIGQFSTNKINCNRNMSAIAVAAAAFQALIVPFSPLRRNQVDGDSSFSNPFPAVTNRPPDHA